MKKEQKDKLIAHLKANFEDGLSCSLCGNPDWTIHDSFYELREFHGGGMVVGGGVVPLVLMQCRKCGNSHTLNAIQIGLISPESGKETK